MKVRITYTPGETVQALRLQALITSLFSRHRVRSNQNGETKIIYLTLVP